MRLAFVHHTENPNGYARDEVSAMLLAIYGFHRFVNGWNDIGYNFVVDRFGRIWEARAGGIEEPVVGAQAGGYNVYSTGVAVLGTFEAGPPSAAAVQALERLLAWKLSLHGAPVSGRTTVKVTPGGARYSRFPAGAAVSLRRISGHRDGDSTVCPGAALYALLPAIRARTQARTPAPSVVKLALAGPAVAPAPASPPAAGPSPAAPAAPATFTVTGTVERARRRPARGRRRRHTGTAAVRARPARPGADARRRDDRRAGGVRGGPARVGGATRRPVTARRLCRRDWRRTRRRLAGAGTAAVAAPRAPPATAPSAPAPAPPAA